MSALFSDGDQTNTNKKSNRQLQPLLLKKSTNENNSKFANNLIMSATGYNSSGSGKFAN